MGEHFQQRELEWLDAAEEVEIETVASGAQEVHRVTIWIVVVGPDVYVRSVSGEQGLWYQQLTAHPVGVIYADEQRIAIRASRVADAQLQEQVSDAYLRKYAQYPHDVAWIIGPDVLPTTLRLEPGAPAACQAGALQGR